MSLLRLPRRCLCIRHVGSFLLAFLLLSTLNALGYLYMYGVPPLNSYSNKLRISSSSSNGDGPHVLWSSSSSQRQKQEVVVGVEMGVSKNGSVNASSETGGRRQLGLSSPGVLASTVSTRVTALADKIQKNSSIPTQSRVSNTLFSDSYSPRVPSPIHQETNRTSSSSSTFSSSSSSYSPSRSSSFSSVKSTRHKTPYYPPFSSLRSYVNISTSPEPNCGDLQFSTTDEKLQRFAPMLKGRTLCSILDTADAFVAALSAANVSFFMYGGTLIGSWRHHGFVPWDDDVDFAVPMDQQQVVYRALMDLKPNFILDVKQKKRWKLYSHHSTAYIRAVTWRYPFLDVNFYHSNATHVWDHDKQNYYMYVYPRDWVFPVTTRPFKGRWWPSPRLAEKSMRLTYQLDTCDTGQYNHRKEQLNKAADRKAVTCTDLVHVLPFVHRQAGGGGCNETLVQGGKVIGYYFFDKTTC